MPQLEMATTGLETPSLPPAFTTGETEPIIKNPDPNLWTKLSLQKIRLTKETPVHINQLLNELNLDNYSTGSLDWHIDIPRVISEEEKGINRLLISSYYYLTAIAKALPIDEEDEAFVSEIIKSRTRLGKSTIITGSKE